MNMILTDELCDKLCIAAREKSKEMGIDISKMDYPGHTVVTEKAVLLWQSRQTILKLQQGSTHD